LEENVNCALPLLICPEAKINFGYSVNLWAIANDRSEIALASAVNWLVLAKMLQAASAMSDATLGAIDACLYRGESVGVLLSSLQAFRELPFVAAASVPKIRNLTRLAAH
jgi:hypothetical protein